MNPVFDLTIQHAAGAGCMFQLGSRKLASLAWTETSRKIRASKVMANKAIGISNSANSKHILLRQKSKAKLVWTDWHAEIDREQRKKKKISSPLKNQTHNINETERWIPGIQLVFSSLVYQSAYLSSQSCLRKIDQDIAYSFFLESLCCPLFRIARQNPRRHVSMTDSGNELAKAQRSVWGQ